MPASFWARNFCGWALKALPASFNDDIRKGLGLGPWEVRSERALLNHSNGLLHRVDQF